jgi:hypothetical protein
LPAHPEVINTQAIVIIPRDECEVRCSDEIILRSLAPRVVEEVVRRGGEIGIPATQQDIDARYTRPAVWFSSCFLRRPWRNAGSKQMS